LRRRLSDEDDEVGILLRATTQPVVGTDVATTTLGPPAGVLDSINTVDVDVTFTATADGGSRFGFNSKTLFPNPISTNGLAPVW
jgi:hypothetical protein